MTTPEIKHSSGEVLLQIVYADPGSNGFYYREKKPDSVAKFYRSDALMHSPEVLALVTATGAMVSHLDEWRRTGAIATPEQSKALYDGLVAARAAFHGVK